MERGNRDKNTVRSRLSVNLFRKVANMSAASSYSFYPLHVTFPNFSKCVRHIPNVAGSTVAAFLPMRYSSSGSATTQRNKGIRNMAILHQCINYVIAPLAECPLNGVQCIKEDGKTILLHLMITSFVADISNAKNRLSINEEFVPPCHVMRVKLKEQISQVFLTIRNGIGRRWKLICRRRFIWMV